MTDFASVLADIAYTLSDELDQAIERCRCRGGACVGCSAARTAMDRFYASYVAYVEQDAEEWKAETRFAGYICYRCAHSWVPRNKDRAPLVCPKCKSPYWDRPRNAHRKVPV